MLSQNKESARRSEGPPSSCSEEVERTRKRHQAKRRGDHGVPLGNPSHGRRMHMGRRIQQRSPNRDLLRRQPSQDAERCSTRSTKPQSAVQMHGPRHFGPQGMIDDVGCGGERPEEGDAQVLRGPPGKYAREPLGRVSRNKNVDVPPGSHGRLPGDDPPKERPLPPVVRPKAEAKAR